MGLSVYPAPAIQLSGEVEIKNDTGNPVPVTPSLPTNAAQQDTLASVLTALQAVQTSVAQIPSDPATDTALTALETVLNSISTTLTSISTTGATEATQATVLARLTSILSDLGGTLAVGVVNWPSDPPTETTLALAVTRLTSILAALGGTLTVTGTVNVGNFPASTEISNDTGNPIPVAGTVAVTGVATETTLAALNTKIPASPATEATLAAIKAGTDKIPASPAQDRTTAAAPSAARLSDGTNFYKPTTPTDTQPVSAVALPLPSGAATSAAQTDGTQKTQIVNSSGNSQAVDSSGRASVAVAADTAHSTGAGATDATTLRVVTANDGPTVAALGTTSDAAVGDATGSINAHVRNLSKILPAALGTNGGLKVEPNGGLYSPPDTTLQAAAGATGTGTPMDVSGLGSVALQVIITGTATVVLEGTVDGTNWVTLYGQHQSNTVVQATTTSSCIWRVGAAGLKQIRARISSWTSGTVTVTGHGVTDGLLPWQNVLISNNVGGFAQVSSWGAQNGNSAGQNALLVTAYQQLFNGTSQDRQYNNNEITPLASAARTTTAGGTSADQINYNNHGLVLVVSVTSAGTGSITPSLQIKLGGNYITIWTAATALTANGTYAYQFYAGAADLGGYIESKQLVITRTWRVVCTHNNSNSVTYAVDAALAL